MSYKLRTRRTQPYEVQKICLNSNNKRARRKPPKLCPDCKEINDCVKLFSNKVSRMLRISINQFSIFNAKFTMNNVPCELEYDLSKFTFENLQKLVIDTTQSYNNNNNDNFNIINLHLLSLLI
jgi:hypothetical protein